jgi:hypothetical protein
METSPITAEKRKNTADAAAAAAAVSDGEIGRHQGKGKGRQGIVLDKGAFHPTIASLSVKQNARC